MADETVRNYNDPHWRKEDIKVEVDDGIQHGIDDDPKNDAEKGAVLGGIGGAVTGAMAGSITGPGGAVLGAVIGGVAGAVASGVAVSAVDRVDNDNTFSGMGEGPTPELDAADRPAMSGSWNSADSTRTDYSTPGATGSRFEDWDSDFRNNWQSNYYTSGVIYEEYQPAYRYGYDLYSDDRFTNWSWPEIESDARMGWETRQPGTWERFKSAIQYGWERAKAAVMGDDYGRKAA